MTTYCVSFADRRMARSLCRLQKQLNDINFFDKLKMFNECDLSFDFRHFFKDKLIHGSRGYGYWCWKPQVIAQILDEMNDGDSLLYLDAGCHVNKSGFDRLAEYFQILENSKTGVLAFQAIPPSPDISPLYYDGRKLFNQPNFEWIKGDLFDYFGVRNEIIYTHSQAIGAGIICIKKTPSSVDLINEWLNIITRDFSLLDDTPSKSPNLDGFKQHRHDQAIFSLLCLRYRVQTLSAYEYWYPTSSNYCKPDWAALKEFPIHAKRDKDFGIFTNTKLFTARVIRKLYL